MAYHLSMDFSRPDNARRINRLKVLSELRKGTCSKAELSRRLDINKVSIGEICDKMIKEGLIEETGREQTAQGRPGTLLSINSKAGRVFSIEEGRKAFSVAVSDLQGRILRYERLPKGESFQDDIQKLIRKMSAGDAVIYGAAIASDYNTMIELPFPSVRISRAEAEAEAEVAVLQARTIALTFRERRNPTRPSSRSRMYSSERSPQGAPAQSAAKTVDSPGRSFFTAA